MSMPAILKDRRSPRGKSDVFQYENAPQTHPAAEHISM
jgi:hypothetical protein